MERNVQWSFIQTSYLAIDSDMIMQIGTYENRLSGFLLFLFRMRFVLPLGRVIHCEITLEKLTCHWCREFSDQDFQDIGAFYIILHR